MQGSIPNIILGSVYCAILIIISLVIILIWKASESRKFDNRVILAMIILVHGLYTLLVSFDFSLLGEKLIFIFTLGLGNALLVAFSMGLLLEKKNLLISFISGTFFIIESAFAMISSVFNELYMVSGVTIGTSLILFIVMVLYTMKKDRENVSTFNILFVIIGLTIMASANGIDFSLSANGHYLGLSILMISGSISILLGIIYFNKTQLRGYNLALRAAMTAMFTALGVVLSFINPFAYFQLGGFKINPFAHLVNALVGVYLGPLWGVLVALFIAIIRFTANIGTIFAFPGGIPGALVVGIIAVVFTAIKKDKYRKFAALGEVIGTVGIGAVMSHGFFGAPSDIFLWGGFAISSLLGSSIGFVVLWILEKRNIDYMSFGESVFV